MSVVHLRRGVSRASVLATLTKTLATLDANKEWTVDIRPYKAKRSDSQNALQQVWHLEASLQLKDESAEDKRAYCKLHFGIPILRAENEDFRSKYDMVIRPLPYETKLMLMKVPADFPVSRLMNTEQTTRFLDAIWNHYTSLGVVLTKPLEQ